MVLEYEWNAQNHASSTTLCRIILKNTMNNLCNKQSIEKQKGMKCKGMQSKNSSENMTRDS